MFALILKIAPWVMKAAPLLGMAKGKAKLIGGIVTVLSILGSYWYVNGLKNDIVELETAVIALTGQLEGCQSANTKNWSTILELKAANSSLAMTIEVSAEMRESAAREAYDRDQRAARNLIRTKQELKDLRNANPTCEQLTKIDMAIACPAVVERLRDLADPDYSD